MKEGIQNNGNFATESLSLPGIIAASTLFVAVILGMLLYFDSEEYVLLLLNWLDTKGSWALIMFTLMMAGVVVLILPGVMFTVGAGFVFGVLKGSLCVILGTTLGGMLAFLMARHLFGSRARRYVLSKTKWMHFSDELAPHGWKIVMLTRMIPFFPFKLSNYFFGVTSFSLRGFVGGTLVGVIPFSLHNVYLGSIAADVTTLGVRHLDRTPFEWVFYIGGFMVTLITVWYLKRLAQAALSKYTEPEKMGDAPCRG